MSNPNPIMLKQIIHIEKPADYKIHVAKKVENEPLDVFISDFKKWEDWNSSKCNGRYGDRRFVISFIDFYPEKGSFLFGGIFEILAVHEDRYDICLCNEYKEFIGRLKVKNIETSRGSAFNFEKHYDSIEVVEVLDKAYTEKVFPGYEWIDIPFEEMSEIIKRSNEGWKNPLGSVYGIYMLTDTKNGKRYIGSAYGESGIWGRWSDYCANYHGNNKQLIELVEKEGEDYIRENFKFTLLEIHSKSTSDDEVIRREEYWKKVMMSSDEMFGYNK